MNTFIFTNKWKKEFEKLDKINQIRIINKLKFLKKYDSGCLILKSLEWMDPATHRLRIWNLRVILQKVSNNEFHILNVWNRWDIYK